VIDGLRMRWSRFRAASQAAREKVLVVGAGEAGQLTLWLLQNSPAAQAFNVVGVVDDDLEKLGTLVHRAPVLGMVERIPEIVEKGDIGLIVFAIHSIDVQRRNEILRQCWQTGARTVVAPDILTFLRKGDAPEDQRAWAPALDLLAEEADNGQRYQKEDVKQAVHELADMARHGDYAALTRALERLDHDLNPGKSGERQDEAETWSKSGVQQELSASD